MKSCNKDHQKKAAFQLESEDIDIRISSANAILKEILSSESSF
ncbi:MAG: hypothetical protein ACFFDW_16580 [Candidatus Thorarchaeota archaeon]